MTRTSVAGVRIRNPTTERQGNLFPYMANIPRYILPRHPYHLIFSTKYRKRCFENRERELRSVFDWMSRRCHFKVLHLGIDRDHVHLLVKAAPSMSVEQIVRIFEFMHRISGKHGLIRQSEFFLYSPNDRAAVEALLNG